MSKQPNVDELARKYEPRSEAALELARRVLGTSLANGYTTSAQADELVEALEVGPTDVVLDLGAGRGWPGIRLARERRCAVVCTDLTVEAAAIAAECVRSADLPRPTPVVVSSGTALPFRPAVFNAVVNADVFC